ncbi:MAG: hypothetical protein EXR81_02595 [Gammaproteobacteria bacterium]|nr:hypothetical protein [Gammaproteobacteria bacterium]
MKYEDDLYEITEDAAIEEEVDLDIGKTESAQSKKKVKRPHNYRVRRQLEDFLEERDLRNKVEYFNDLIE